MPIVRHRTWSEAPWAVAGHCRAAGGHEGSSAGSRPDPPGVGCLAQQAGQAQNEREGKWIKPRCCSGLSLLGVCRLHAVACPDRAWLLLIGVAQAEACARVQGAGVRMVWWLAAVERAFSRTVPGMIHIEAYGQMRMLQLFREPVCCGAQTRRKVGLIRGVQPGNAQALRLSLWAVGAPGPCSQLSARKGRSRAGVIIWACASSYRSTGALGAGGRFSQGSGLLRQQRRADWERDRPSAWPSDPQAAAHGGEAQISPRADQGRRGRGH